MTIDLSKAKEGDTVKFRCGGSVVIGKAHNSPNSHLPISLSFNEDTYHTAIYYRKNGKRTEKETLIDIIAIEPAPEPIVGYVNIYNSKMFAYDSEEHANDGAGRHRIALLKFSYNPATGEPSVEVVK